MHENSGSLFYFFLLLLLRLHSNRCVSLRNLFNEDEIKKSANRWSLRKDTLKWEKRHHWHGTSVQLQVMQVCVSTCAKEYSIILAALWWSRIILEIENDFYSIFRLFHLFSCVGKRNEMKWNTFKKKKTRKWTNIKISCLFDYLWFYIYYIRHILLLDSVCCCCFLVVNALCWIRIYFCTSKSMRF